MNAVRTAVGGLSTLTAVTLQDIMLEKYIAQFQNIDVWNDFKRTCFPLVKPYQNNAEVPGRLPYGSAERTANPNLPLPSEYPAKTTGAAQLRNWNDPDRLPEAIVSRRGDPGVPADPPGSDRPPQGGLAIPLTRVAETLVTAHRMTIRHRVRSGVLMLLIGMGACWVETPIGTAVPAPETRVVAQVTDSGTVAMASLIGAGATAVEGVVASADAASWELALLEVRHRDGSAIGWNRERVVFPRSALADPRERRIDRTRSWLAAGAVAVGAILAAGLFDVIGGGDEDVPPPIPPAQILKPGSGTPE